MDRSLLVTKYSLPLVESNLTERPHLVQKLDEALISSKRLILVCAPAGYGKTTLVGDWVRRVISSSGEGASTPRLAWLTCDPEDDDLGHFLIYLTAALGSIHPKVGTGLMGMLRAAKPPTPQVLATMLINDLAEIPGRFVVVLDDFHTILSQPVLDFLAFLVEHQPPQMCLVLLTRADPALPVARLRGRGQLEEIRQNDLAFSPEEAIEYLHHRMNAAIPKNHLIALVERTEGWIAGLQLASLSIRSTKVAQAFINAFSGGDEYIADYLAGEVLIQQSDAIQSFLLRTSILDRLSTSLCTAVTGESQAQAALETLRENNLFLIPLDHHKEWYRYHPLFADLLQNRLNQAYSVQVVDDLHLRASRWYEENGLAAQAIEHALAGHASDRAAVLIEQAVASVFINGQVATVLRWMEALPTGAKDERPLLWIYHGLALIWCGKSAESLRSRLLELDAVIESKGLMGEAASLRGLIAMTGGHPVEAAQFARNALKDLTVGNDLFSCLASDIAGMAFVLQSDLPAAIRAFEQTAGIAARAGFVMFEILALSHLSGLHLQRGQLKAAAASYQRAMDRTVSQLGKRAPVAGQVLLGLGELAREWNDLEGALKYYLESAEMFAQFADLGIPIADLSIARVKANMGEWEAAQGYLDRAAQYAQSSQATRMNDRLVSVLQARFWITRGELVRAEQWAQQNGLTGRTLSEMITTVGLRAAGSEFVYSDYITLTRLYLAQNKTDAALEVIESLLKVAGSMGYMRRSIQILTLKALAWHQKEAKHEAVETLCEALAMAEPEGYLRVFLDEGEPMLRLLYLVLEQGNSSGYLKTILAEFSKDAINPPPKDEILTSDRLFEPLSEREREILSLIAEGLSNREISARLYLSLSTVKGHTANIYGKLGVNSRTQALSKAAQLGLLKH